MKSLKFESLPVSSLKVGASLEFERLNGNPAWKFEAAATRCQPQLGPLSPKPCRGLNDYLYYSGGSLL